MRVPFIYILYIYECVKKDNYCILYLVSICTYNVCKFIFGSASNVGCCSLDLGVIGLPSIALLYHLFGVTCSAIISSAPGLSYILCIFPSVYT